MSDTSVQTSPKPVPAGITTDAPRPGGAKPKSRKGPVRRVIEALASLKLTVALLAMSIVLVFCGTLAQLDHGIWAVVNSYFRSFFVLIPLLIFFPRTYHIPPSIVFPFPGGWAIGSLLLVNLVAAHATRFKISWKRTGIFLIHIGLIVLMMGELITGMFAIEGNMSIATGQSANYVEQSENMELAVVTRADAQHDELTSVPVSRLRKLRKGDFIRDEYLPFDIQVVKYMPNTGDLVSPAKGAANLATAGVGLNVVAVEQPEGVGVDPDQKYDVPSAYLELKKKGAKESLGVYMVTALSLREPQTVKSEGVDYEISLRPHRDYKDYTLHLEQFTHTVYPGTNVPKEFKSRIQLVDPKHNEDREVLIYMNQPLRYQGETFYQAGVLGRDEGTILQVVHNPGSWLPYIACTMVIVGLAVHFGMSLVIFLRRRVLS
jgi:ResB-like family